MSFYGDQVLPRVVNVLLGNRECAQMRARATAALSGEVLEVGFGSGLNVPHLPATVTRLRAVDPATVGRKLAAKRVAKSPVPVEYVGLNGEELTLADASVDHVLSTWTLCTIPAVDRALTEILRVLRPGGAFHFVEHGRSPDEAVAKWQDRLTPIQRRIGGGCHLNRPIDTLIERAGFQVANVDHHYMRGPKAFGYMYEGVATKPA